MLHITSGLTSPLTLCVQNLASCLEPPSTPDLVTLTDTPLFTWAVSRPSKYNSDPSVTDTFYLEI